LQTGVFKALAMDIQEFSPHGISVWREGDIVTVAAVNHRRSGSTVELFTHHINHPFKNSLNHVKTVKDVLFSSPNGFSLSLSFLDIALVGPDSFYVTQDFNTHGIARLIGTYFRLKQGHVAFWDGSKARIVVPGFVMAV
jgi:hypothetical protein